MMGLFIRRTWDRTPLTSLKKWNATTPIRPGNARTTRSSAAYEKSPLDGSSPLLYSAGGVGCNGERESNMEGKGRSIFLFRLFLLSLLLTAGTRLSLCSTSVAQQNPVETPLSSSTPQNAAQDPNNPTPKSDEPGKPV